MTRALALERFDRGEVPPGDRPAGGRNPEGAPENDMAPDGMRAFRGPAGEAAVEDPATAAASCEPEQPLPPDEDQRLAILLDGLVDSVNALGARLPEIRSDAIARVAAAAAPAIAALLPTIVERHFTEELCAAVARIVAAGALAEPRLAVSEADHDAIMERVATRGPDLAMAIVADPRLRPGEARLTWRDGGATFDRDELVAAAAALLDRSLAPLSTPEHRQEA